MLFLFFNWCFLVIDQLDQDCGYKIPSLRTTPVVQPRSPDSWRLCKLHDSSSTKDHEEKELCLLSANVPPSLYTYCKAVRGPQAAGECAPLERSDLVLVVDFCGSAVGEG